MRRPVHEIRFGLIRVSVWLNQTKFGPRHSVTAQRRYRDGDVWRSSEIFGRDDLPLLCKALDQAHTWIFSAIQQERAEATTQAEPEHTE